jgi:hypothetical protein
MPPHAPRLVFRLGLVFCDVILMGIAWVNIVSMEAVADLPDEYRPKVQGLSSNAANMGASRAILRIEGNRADSPGLLRYYLCTYLPGDSVAVTDVRDNHTSERKIGLVSRYSLFDLWTIIAVGAVFCAFGIYVVVKHSSRPFASVLHALAIGTAVMIAFDWGSMKLYPAWFNALRWFIFDVGIWILPSLFLHFSFMYPHDKSGHKRLVTKLFYGVSLAGIGVSAYYLTRIFFQGLPLHDTQYLIIHGGINDGFLIAGLLCTVANLEHSALAIHDPYDRKRIYWVLLGIFFGPLVYVFLILVPRMMLDYELVSESIMQYTLLMAPFMFYLAIRKTPNGNSISRLEA